MVKKYQKGYYFDTSERYKSNKGYFGKGVWKKDGKKIGLGVISTDDLGDQYQLNSDGTAIKIKDSKGITSAGQKLLSKKGLVSGNAEQNTPEEDEGLSANIVTGIAKKLGLDDNLQRLENSGIAGALTSGIIKSLPYFTPVGSLISGYDAIKNFRKGRWKEGLTDAAFILPFIGGLGKLAKVGAKAYKPLAKPMAKTANRLNRLQKSNFSKFSNGFGLGMIGNDIYHAFFQEGGLIKAQNGDKFNYFKKYAEEKKKVQEEQKQNGTNLESRWNNTLNKHLNNVDSKVQKEKTVRDKAVKKESRRRNNYVENVAGLQERLFKGGFYDEGTTFEQAVDGIMGSKTKKALAKEAAARKNTPLPTKQTNQQEEDYSPRIITTGGAYIPTPVIEQASKATAPGAMQAGDYITNNPAALLFEDLNRAALNRAFEKLTGKRPLKGRTITTLPTLQKEELIKQIQFAKGLGKQAFDEEAFKKMYGYDYASSKGEEGKYRGILGRMKTPRERLEHTLGVYPFYEDAEGNTIVDNEYDFNVNQHQNGENRYAKLRNFAGEFASKSIDPREGKIIYKINLGKI